MATKENSTISPRVAAIHAEAIAKAEGMKVTVQLLAEQLRDMMSSIHGGEWRIQEDDGFIIVAQRPDRTIPRPRGALA